MRVNILGSLEVVKEGNLLNVPGEKLRSLIAVLSLSPGRPVSRNELIDELWGEAPPRNAENSLHGHIARLRRILAAELGERRPRTFVQTAHAGYTLALPAEAVDAVRFQALVHQAEDVADADPGTATDLFTRALELWRGPALLDAGEGPVCRMAGTRLEETRLTAYERLFDARLRLGQHRAVIPDLEQLHAQYPLREHFCEQLLTALYRSGRQADALDAYHRTRQSLLQGLGLVPGRALRARFQEVLRQDPALL